MLIILILLLLFALLTGLVYLILFSLTYSFTKLTRRPVLNSDNKRKLRNIFLVSSLIIAGAVAYIFLFTSPSSNNKTAFIGTANGHFVLTIKGRRSYMAHDPISLLSRETYEDSTKYIIPRNQGSIKGEEILTKPGYYKLVGTITIQNNQVEVALLVDNYDDKKLEPDTWNGTYKLVSR